MSLRKLALRQPKEAVHPIRDAVSEFVATALYVFGAEGSKVALKKLYGCTSSMGVLIMVVSAHVFAFTCAVTVSTSLSGYDDNVATFGDLLRGWLSLVRVILDWTFQLFGPVGVSLLLRITTSGMDMTDWNAMVLAAVTNWPLRKYIFGKSLQITRWKC